MKKITRREAIKRTMLGAAAVAVGGDLFASEASTPLKGNIKQSVSKWCFGDIPLAEFADTCKELGLQSIELLSPEDWKTVTDRGLDVALPQAGDVPLDLGFCNVEFHRELTKRLEVAIGRVSDAGLKNLVCFSGNRRGMTSEQGWDNAVRALEKVVPLAEERGVTLVMELLNSYGHTDYFADHTSWGVELCRRVGSNNFKLLYDIYHMQMMEGNVIDTITKNIDYIAHFHTAGVPGRNEIDDSQELNYPAIMKAILATGYKGYVGHEFVPKNEDRIASLAQAIKICDI